MKYSNNLNSHYSERSSSPIGKMSGTVKECQSISRKEGRSDSYRKMKLLYKRKSRRLINNDYNLEKLFGYENYI